MAESKVNLGAGFRQKFRENNPRPSYDSEYETPSSDFSLGDTAYTAASLGAGFAPGAGIADLFGQMPDPYNPGQMSPSFSENVGEGNYLDAGLQVLGGAGDALYMLGATAPLGAALKGAQALGKAARGSKADIPVFPKRQDMWEDRRPGGDYIHPATKEVLTGRTPSSANISVKPESAGGPQFYISGDNLEEVGNPQGTQVLVNLLKRKKAGWVPSNEALDLPALVSVKNKNKHYYTTDIDFTKGVKLEKYPDAKTEPRLRPTVKGELEFGNQVGTITYRKRVHPVYDKIEVKADGGVVGNDVFTLDDLQGMADTEFVVDLIGSGDDMASNLAQRGLRDIQRRSTEGGLSTFIRNLGGDATVEEFQMPDGLGYYNPSTEPVPMGEGYSDEPYIGSRGPVTIAPRGIILGQNAEKGTIRHELEHAGITALTNPLNVDIQQAGGKYPYELLDTPISALSRVISDRNTAEMSPYTDYADHFLIESMQASERLRSGQGLSDENVRQRESFFVIGDYLNNPTPEKKAVVLKLLEDIMSITPEEYGKASYGEKVILNAGYDIMGFFRKKQLAEGVPRDQLINIDRITPEFLLQNLEQSIANYGSPPEKRYSTKVFEKGGEVEGGIVTIPVDREPRPADQRNEAFGAKLLKLAGLATTPRQLAGKVDPMVYRQVDEVLGRKPSFRESDGGIGSMKQY